MRLFLLLFQRSYPQCTIKWGKLFGVNKIQIHIPELFIDQDILDCPANIKTMELHLKPAFLFVLTVCLMYKMQIRNVHMGNVKSR